MNRLTPVAEHDIAHNSAAARHPLFNRKVVGRTYVKRLECREITVVECCSDADDVLPVDDAIADDASCSRHLQLLERRLVQPDIRRNR